MEDTNQLKEEQQVENVAVNYENLHAGVVTDDKPADTSGTEDKVGHENLANHDAENGTSDPSALKLDSTDDQQTIEQHLLQNNGADDNQTDLSSDVKTTDAEPPKNGDDAEIPSIKVDDFDDTNPEAEQEEESFQDIAKQMVESVMDGASEQYTAGNAEDGEEESELAENTNMQPPDVTKEILGGDAQSQQEADSENIEPNNSDKPHDAENSENGEQEPKSVEKTNVQPSDGAKEFVSGDTSEPSQHETEPDNIEPKDTDKSKGDVASDQQKNDEDAEKSEKPKDEWVDILGNGTLRKKVITPGEGENTRPAREKEVTIKYEARLKDGEEIVDSNENLAIVLGEKEFLDVFDLVVALMQNGEKAIVECDSRFAYGDDGEPPKIPPKSSIIFQIELVSIASGPFSPDIDLDKRLQWADTKRQKGNSLYTKMKYEEATMVYTRAIRALEKGWLNEDSEESRARINEMRLKCYNNLTVAQMKLQRWNEAFQSCHAAEKLDPENVKTLFRSGKIRCELGELDTGVEKLSKASKLDPDNKVIAAELAKQNKKLQKQIESQKSMYRRMLGSVGGTSKKDKEPAQKSWLGHNWGRLVGGTLAAGAVLVGLYVAQKM